MKTIMLDTIVKVKLTKLGQELLTLQLWPLHTLEGRSEDITYRSVQQSIKEKMDEYGYYTTPLYDLIRTFGAQSMNWVGQIFENSEIIFDEKELREKKEEEKSNNTAKH